MSPNKQKLVMHAFQKATLRSSKQLEVLGLYRADIQTAQRERRIERVAEGRGGGNRKP